MHDLPTTLMRAHARHTLRHLRAGAFERPLEPIGMREIGVNHSLDLAVHVILDAPDCRFGVIQ
jgi:hypothetical protein